MNDDYALRISSNLNETFLNSVATTQIRNFEKIASKMKNELTLYIFGFHSHNLDERFLRYFIAHIRSQKLLSR